MRKVAMKELQVVEQAEINHEQVNRRQFLITAGLAGGGLLLKCSLHPTEVLASESVEAAKAIPLNAWLCGQVGLGSRRTRC
jgi:hypothetical protein